MLNQIDSHLFVHKDNIQALQKYLYLQQLLKNLDSEEHFMKLYLDNPNI